MELTFYWVKPKNKKLYSKSYSNICSGEEKKTAKTRGGDAEKVEKDME